MKKRTITLLSVLCMLCTLFSCKKSIETTTTDGIATKNSYSKIDKGDTTIHKLTINGNTNTVLEINGKYYIGDDMILPKEGFEALKKEALSNTIERGVFIKDLNGGDPVKYYWPNGVVYFKYPVFGATDGGVVTALNQQQFDDFKIKIDSAMTEITDSTGIVFKERTDQTAYITFTHSNRNEAIVGYWPGLENPVRINGVDRKNTIMHEIMHALGVYHEHQRNDRDQYLIINAALVLQEYEAFFEKHSVSGYKGLTPDFDYNSIMLYARGLGCIDGGNCMTKINGDLLPRLGDKKGLSVGDAAVLRQLYPTAAARRVSGVYRIQSSTDATKFLYTNSTATFITSEAIHHTNNHKYQFVRTGITYQIKPVQQVGKALAINAAGTQITLEDVSETAQNQKFKLIWKDINTFSVRPATDGAENLRLNFSTHYVSIEAKNSATTNQTIKLVKLQ